MPIIEPVPVTPKKPNKCVKDANNRLDPASRSRDPHELFGLAVEENATGVVLGYCGLTFDAKRCQSGELEIGFRLVKRAWGHGFATEAAGALCDRRASKVVIAIIDPQNARSLRIATKLGMRFVREFTAEHYDHPDLVFARQ